MVGLSMTKLRVTIRTDMRLVAGFGGVLNLIRAFTFAIAVVPFGARSITFLRFFSSHIFLLESFSLWDGFNSLHHACWIHLSGDTWPGEVTMIEITEYSPVVVTCPVPGVSGEILVGGEHGGQLHEMEEVLQPANELSVGHRCDLTLARG